MEPMKINRDKNTWFKLCCYYQATTELYDRNLTFLRSPYDETEAYVIGENKKWSSLYSKKQYEKVMDIANMLEIHKAVIKVNGMCCNCKFSAQGWIDQYQNLVKGGEMKFIKEYL